MVPPVPGPQRARGSPLDPTDPSGIQDLLVQDSQALSASKIRVSLLQLSVVSPPLTILGHLARCQQLPIKVVRPSTSVHLC